MFLFLIFTLAFGANAFLTSAYKLVVPDHQLTFNPSFFESVLDEQLCREQLQHIVTNDTLLLLQLMDAGFRVPSGLVEGNIGHYGNYHQCLNIHREVPERFHVQGKYCTINIPFSQATQLPAFKQFLELNGTIDLPWRMLNHTLGVKRDAKQKIALYQKLIHGNQYGSGSQPIIRSSPEDIPDEVGLILAVCIPKPCTTRQAISELLLDPATLRLQYSERYCRLPGDKQWVAADYVAIALFSLLLLLVIASTGYDVYQTKILGKESRELNKVYQSFSVVTNTRQLVTYTPVPGAIESLDGMRALSMMWIILGHMHFKQLYDMVVNPVDFITWATSPYVVWITMYRIGVDTFFMMSGLLVVYTTAGKLTRSGFMKNLPMFYLNRLLRMFPVLAAMVLLQASLLNWITDGPNWTIVARNSEKCRMYWWSALLHIQNWVNPAAMCLNHAWYLSVDVQLYILSPLVLFWLPGGGRRAWAALATWLVLTLLGSSVYNFIVELQSVTFAMARILTQEEYFVKYYINTLTRASAFAVGMLVGYVFHLYRRERLRIPRVVTIVLWLLTFLILGLTMWVHYLIMQPEWDNQLVDNLVNSYMRPAWALATGWIALACHHGYGGPINWFLSLSCFKVLSRLSYAMYLVHYPFIYMLNSTILAPLYFDANAFLYKYLSDFLLAALVAYLLTLLVDAPCAVLVKRFLGRGSKKPEPSPSIDITKPSEEKDVSHHA